MTLPEIFRLALQIYSFEDFIHWFQIIPLYAQLIVGFGGFGVIAGLVILILGGLSDNHN